MGHPCFDVAHEFLGIVLNVVEHVGHGFAVDDAVNLVAVFIDGDMHGVGVAEQIVHVAEDFLIGSDKEHAEIVGLAGADAMDGEGGRCAVAGDEICQFAVGVAGDVLDCASAVGAFVEAGYGYDGKHLVNGPCVGE